MKNTNYNDRQESRTHNSRLPQWGLTWLNQVQCFYQHLCLVDSEVLRNPPLRQAAKRYVPALKKQAIELEKN
ncbi:MAG: hypothetical protein C0432_06170 [Candidatus Puniceispirillum sp.]|nr:hypothetical protein [Candidatus Puniceispirillum sp.]